MKYELITQNIQLFTDVFTVLFTFTFPIMHCKFAILFEVCLIVSMGNRKFFSMSMNLNSIRLSWDSWHNLSVCLSSSLFKIYCG